MFTEVQGYDKTFIWIQSNLRHVHCGSVKEIEHLEAQVAGAKDHAHEQYTELARLRDISYGMDKDLDA